MSQDKRNIPFLPNSGGKSSPAIPVDISDPRSIYDEYPILAMTSDPQGYVDPSAFITSDNKVNWLALTAPLIAAGAAKMTGRDAAKSFNRFVDIGQGFMKGQQMVMQQNMKKVEQQRLWRRFNMDVQEKRNEELKNQIENVAQVNPTGAAKLMQKFWASSMGINLPEQDAMAMIEDMRNEKERGLFQKQWDMADESTRIDLMLTEKYKKLYPGAMSNKTIERLLSERDAAYYRSLADKDKAELEQIQASDDLVFGKDPIVRENQLAAKKAELMRKRWEETLKAKKAEQAERTFTVDQKKKAAQNAILLAMRISGLSVGASSGASWGAALGSMPNLAKLLDVNTMELNGSPDQNDQFMKELISQFESDGMANGNKLKKAAVIGYLNMLKVAPSMLELEGGGQLRFEDLYPALNVSPEIVKEARKEMGMDQVVVSSLEEVTKNLITQIENGARQNIQGLPEEKSKMSTTQKAQYNSFIRGAIEVAVSEQKNLSDPDKLKLRKNLYAKYGIGSSTVTKKDTSNITAPKKPRYTKDTENDPLQEYFDKNQRLW